jgi:hypothetical protein
LDDEDVCAADRFCVAHVCLVIREGPKLDVTELDAELLRHALRKVRV